MLSLILIALTVVIGIASNPVPDPVSKKSIP